VEAQALRRVLNELGYIAPVEELRCELEKTGWASL
jgi:hypothetical protein